MPVTVRIPSFGGIGAVEHHSESTETYWGTRRDSRLWCPRHRQTPTGYSGIRSRRETR